MGPCLSSLVNEDPGPAGRVGGIVSWSFSDSSILFGGAPVTVPCSGRITAYTYLTTLFSRYCDDSLGANSLLANVGRIA
jgi:hypothetical protein